MAFPGAGWAGGRLSGGTAGKRAPRACQARASVWRRGEAPPRRQGQGAEGSLLGWNVHASVRPGSKAALAPRGVTLAITYPEAPQAKRALSLNFHHHCCQLGVMPSLSVSGWPEGGLGCSPGEGRWGQPGHVASGWQVFAKPLIWGCHFPCPPVEPPTWPQPGLCLSLLSVWGNLITGSTPGLLVVGLPRRQEVSRAATKGACQPGPRAPRQ